MQVSDILDLLRSRFVEIQIYRSVVKDLTKEEVKRLSEYMEQESNSDDSTFPFLSLQSMYFQDLKTGALMRYGFTEFSAQHKQETVYKYKNKQYGWLLVEAYEEFEDFLERIYAYIGMTSRSAWYLEDFGRAKLSELDDKSFDWYLDRVRQKYRLKHRDLLTRIRDVYPELKSVEENNIYNVHVRVAVELIENLRHRIVHTRGIVRDRDDFVKNILKKSGLWNNGRPKPGLKQFIEWFLQHNAGTYTVSLSERRTAPLGSPIDSYIDVWDELMTYLMAYAHLICNCVCPILSGREPPHLSPAAPHPGSHQPVVADGSQAVSPRSPQSRTSVTPSRSRFSVDFSAQRLDGGTVPSREADPAAQNISPLRTTGTQQGSGDTAGHTRNPAVDEQQRQSDRRGSGDFEHEDRLEEGHVPENQGSDGNQKRIQRHTASSRTYENLEEDNVRDGCSQQDPCLQGQPNLGDGHRKRPPSIDDGGHDGNE